MGRPASLVRPVEPNETISMKRHFLILGLVVALPAVATGQQGRQLSLDEALRLAGSQSEAIRIAQAGVLRADGQKMVARSQSMPQFGLSFAYTRTLASQFQALSDAGAPGPPSDWRRGDRK